MKQPIWTPDDYYVQQSNMHLFMLYIKDIHDRSIENYYDLHKWSINNIEKFWEEIWKYSKLKHSIKYQEVLQGKDFINCKWFPGSKLNFAENLLRFNDYFDAIIYLDEEGNRQKFTYKELYEHTAKVAYSFLELGIKSGDVVAAYITNIPEAIISMLAATSIGAIWTSVSPEFGVPAVMDRFSQIEPKLLIASAKYKYAKKEYETLDKVEEIVNKINSIETLVLLNRDAEDKHIFRVKNLMMYEQLLLNSNEEIQFEQLPFDHPVYIMYSSGTTGKPKCLVHSAGCTLLQHYKELFLHTDLKRTDHLFYYSTTGWMMWNWMVSSLMCGATIIQYNGSPTHPEVNNLWHIAEEYHISIFGTSPKYLKTIEKEEYFPNKEFKLQDLRIILSTGAPLPASSYKFVYENIKSNIQLSSISGGTDIISCFVLGNPMLPVYEEEIQCIGLGMDVHAYDKDAKSINDEKGELVCIQPFPSKPVYFWNDKDNIKYHEAYFNHYPKVWRHGDYITITERQSIIMYGRSDATLNPGGIRIGTAEIYNVVESIEQVKDSLIIAQKFNDDVRLILFVEVNIPSLTNTLQEMIRSKIKNEISHRHVPEIILQVTDIPRTLNGKKVELAVTKIFHGEEVENVDSIDNPSSLSQYKKLAKEIS